MNKMIIKKAMIGLMVLALGAGSLTACGGAANGSTDAATEEESVVTEETTDQEETETSESAETVEASTTTVAASQTSNVEIITTVANVTSGGAIDASDMFTDRDMRQNVDLNDAEYITVSDGNDIEITKEGIYVLSGTATDVTISIDTTDNEKVQLVLDGVEITNEDAPAIYVKNADKVFVTTSDGKENTLIVTGTFVADGETNTDAVIYSKDDLILNGLGTLNISSTANGITSKDDLKITGGIINIGSVADALEVNNTVAIADGEINISTYKDGIHAEYSEDDTEGAVYICGGTLTIEAEDDGIQGTTIVQIDGGVINITGAEGIEGTYVQINGGEISISASDDGINAAYKSSAYDIVAEFNGGYTYIVMGQGDTDAVDSNGSIYVNGGTLDLYAQSPFDYDYYAENNGGTLLVNGTETSQITNQMMGGPGGGMMGGRPGGGGPGFGG